MNSVRCRGRITGCERLEEGRNDVGGELRRCMATHAGM